VAAVQTCTDALARRDDDVAPLRRTADGADRHALNTRPPSGARASLGER